VPYNPAWFPPGLALDIFQNLVEGVLSHSDFKLGLQVYVTENPSQINHGNSFADHNSGLSFESSLELIT